MNTNTNTINEMIATVKTFLNAGEEAIRAASKAESLVIQDFREARREKLQLTALHVMRNVHKGDKAKCLEILKRASESLNQDAEYVNITMAEFAGRVARKFKKWTTKEQHSLTERVQMGTGTKMKTGDYEYKGFDGDETFNYLTTLEKERWARLANAALLRKLSDGLVSLIHNAAPKSIAASVLYLKPEGLQYRYGVLTLGCMFRVLGSLSRGAAYFDKYCIVDVHAGRGCVLTDEDAKRVEYTTERIYKLSEKLNAAFASETFGGGSHYLQEEQDELAELERRKDGWVQSHLFWEKLEHLVLEYNKNGESIPGFVPLPVSDLEEMAKYEQKSLIDALESELPDCQVRKLDEIKEKMELAKENAQKALEALFN